MIDEDETPDAREDRARYSRQSRLAEVGREGQTRLAETEACLGALGVAGLVAARYAAGAGFRRICVSEPEARGAARAMDSRVNVRVEAQPASVAPAWLGVVDPAARDVALGAYEALVAVRTALGILRR
jgi:hypothetical protein